MGQEFVSGSGKSGLRPQGAHRMRPLQDVVNLRLTALCIADRLSCLYRSRDLVHHSFFPGSQIKGSNANRNNIKTDNISHTSGTGSPALVPSLASYCFMVTSGIKSGGETKFRPRQNFSAGKRLYSLRAPSATGRPQRSTAPSSFSRVSKIAFTSASASSAVRLRSSARRTRLKATDFLPSATPFPR